MLRSIIKYGALLVIGILVYNYFFGTDEEKAQSKQIFSEVRDLTRSAVGLLKTEKAKFDEGKYDEAVDKVGGLLDNLKGKAQLLEDNRDLLDQITELQHRKEDLERHIDETPTSYDETEGRRIVADRSEQREIEREWDDLLNETRDLVDEMERRAAQQSGE